MAESYRRIIRRPSGVDDGSWSRLGELLAEAVKRQGRLASESSHILRLLGGLQELADGSGFFVEHESATAMPIGGFFDRSAPTVHESELLRMTVAVFEALRTAHVREGERPVAHGAVCPGVIGFAPDGAAKITDFGFAPAICDVLGEEAYVNLAIGPEEGTEPGMCVTGAWEVLTRDEYERDGRICAFIDPEKYGSDSLGAFEPASDIIAAAFILHLLAEHQHPYLSNDPDAHRLVETSAFMAALPYNGARRRDLRESKDPGVRLWCELIAGSLARLPKNRTTAASIVDALRDHVKPDDEGDVLRRRLESVEALAEQKAWDQVRQAARSLAENKAAPADVVQRANALAVQAEASALVDRARDALGGDDWPTADEPIDRVLSTPGVSADLASQAREIRGGVKSSLAAREVLDEVDLRLARDERADPFETVELMQALLDELGKYKTDPALLPQVRGRLNAVHRRITGRLEEALPAAQASMEAERTRATEWAKKLESAVESAQWDALEKLLADRPQLRLWPAEIQARVDAVQQRLDEHLNEEKQREAIEEDHAAASLWIDQLRLAAAAQRWERAEQLLKDKPVLTHWPPGVADEADQLAEGVHDACKKHADEQQARQWYAQLRGAVKSGDFDAGAKLLSERPTLEHWPPNVLDEVARYEQQLDQWIVAAKHERKREAEEKRQIDEWLDRAELASKNGQWEEAVSIIEAPPPVESIPGEARTRAARLKETCLAKIAAKLREQQKARTEAIEALARDFVREVMTTELDGLMHPDSVDVWIAAEAPDRDRSSGDWQVKVRPRLPRARRRRSGGEDPATIMDFHFRVSDESRQICDEDGSRRGQLRNELRSLLEALQKSGVTDLRDRLRAGLFPQADITVLPGEPAKTMPATARLLGMKSSAGCVETEIVWDPKELAWAYAAPADFVRRASRVAADAIAEELEQRLLGGAAQLQRYRSMLAVEADPVPVPGLDALPKPLELQGRVAIRPDGPVAAQTLQTFSVGCARLGHVDCNVDLTPVAAKLREIVRDAQLDDWEALKARLEGRVKDPRAKARVVALPRRIVDPVEQVRFRLEARPLDPFELVCTWDMAEFSFVLPDRWEEALGDFLRQTAEVPRGPRGIGAAFLRRTVARLGGGRRVVAVVASLLSAIVVIGAWLTWPENDPPTAQAGDGFAVSEGDRVTLDATGSRDPDGDALTYAWRQNGGPQVVLSDPNSAQPTFPAPEADLPTRLTFEVEVSDGRRRSADTVIVTVNPVVPANRPPEARAGMDQTVEGLTLVTLDATDSRDPDGDDLKYRWTRRRGPNVTLSGADTAQPWFTAPGMTALTTLTFEVQVSDDHTSSTDAVTVTINPVVPANEPPVARAGPDQTVDAMAEVTLDAAGSEDPDGDALEYEWTQTGGPRVTLSAAKAARPTFTAPDVTEATALTFQLEVTDRTESSTDTVTINVNTRRDPAAEFISTNEAYALAGRKQAAGDWRAARFFLDQAAIEAAEAGLTDELADTLAAANQRLTDALREALAPLLAEAARWLKTAVPPTDPRVLLADVENPTTARRMLDELDLDFPRRADRANLAEAALQEGVLPWTVLTNAQTTTVLGLLDWTIASLRLGADDDAAGETIDVTFIPAAPARGVLDPIWMSQTEITVGEYTAVMGQAPSNAAGEVYDLMVSQGRHPVAFIPAGNVHDFFLKLSARLGDGFIVRPPTASEWSHAFGCGRDGRASAPQLYTFGQDGTAQFDPARANFESDEEYLLTAPGHEDGYGFYAPVGSYPPNGWFLYDLLGNVSEWVSTSTGGRLSSIGGSFRDTAAEDPPGPRRRDQRLPSDEIGLRIAVLPAP